MKNFIQYAQYYNILYKEKDYKKEVDYVDRLIRQYSAKHNKTLLDIGCGTGNHDLWFSKKGYKVVGIDKSSEMISIAKNQKLPKPRMQFYTANACSFALKRKFDIAISLFHVMSYLTTNEVVINSLRNIYKHLKKNGLFIFDFWYGPAVLTQKPSLIVKKLMENETFIKRTAIPKINFNDNIVDIHYQIEIKNRINNLKKAFTERHVMRYFFLPELYLMLEMTGFKALNCLEWMSLEKGASEDSWSGVIIAKKG